MSFLKLSSSKSSSNDSTVNESAEIVQYIVKVNIWSLQIYKKRQSLKHGTASSQLVQGSKAVTCVKYVVDGTIKVPCAICEEWFICGGVQPSSLVI